MENKIKLLLLEDNELESKAFQEFVSKIQDISLVATTNSSIEAISLVKQHSPHAIIVDLELHDGVGSGFEFLNQFKKLSLPVKPVILVTTNIISQFIYDKLHKEFVDLIFYKKQSDYSPKLVIDSLLLLLPNGNKTTQETKDSSIVSTVKDPELCDRINHELDLVGISYKLKGREYLFEAIYYLLTKDDPDISVFQYLSSQYKLLTSSLGRAIQTAINHAWRTTAIEDLHTYYTAPVNYQTGVPTPTEFIYFFVKKLKI